jgi:hypothetical protein
MPNLSLAHWLVVISTLISLAGAYSYIRDTLQGNTKPNRVSWSMWALAPLIGAIAAITSGGDAWATVRVFMAGFLPLTILFASFVNAKSYWRLTPFDFGCGALSFAALIVWLAADSPRVAILLAVAGDGFAAIPTISKAWKFPETETGLFFCASFASSLLVLPSIPVWTIENAAFPIHLTIVSAIVLFSVYRKRLNPRFHSR